MRNEELGFVNPNGVVTGRIQTKNGNPVPNAVVTIEPTFGFALDFDGIDDHICVGYHEDLLAESFTVSSWIQLGTVTDGSPIIDLGLDLNQNWWLRESSINDPAGVVFGIGGGGPFSVTEFNVVFSQDPDAWHHVAAVFNGSAVTLYLSLIHI